MLHCVIVFSWDSWQMASFTEKYKVFHFEPICKTSVTNSEKNCVEV